DHWPGLELQEAHHRRLVAVRREETEVHRHPVEPLGRLCIFVDPLDRVVALDLGPRLLRGLPVALAYLLERTDARLDTPPLGSPRGPRHAQEEDQEQDSARHQKPSAAPSPRGSAPPRSVPSWS